jgi:hypothetical protein
MDYEKCFRNYTDCVVKIKKPEKPEKDKDFSIYHGKLNGCLKVKEMCDKTVETNMDADEAIRMAQKKSKEAMTNDERVFANTGLLMAQNKAGEKDPQGVMLSAAEEAEFEKINAEFEAEEAKAAEDADISKNDIRLKVIENKKGGNKAKKKSKTKKHYKTKKRSKTKKYYKTKKHYKTKKRYKTNKLSKKCSKTKH